MTTLRDRALEWLRGKEPTAIVGWRSMPERCPLANLLREVAGAAYPLVRRDGSYKTDIRPPLDKWLRPGPWALAANATVRDPRDTPVTADECLALWEAIPDAPP